jgi:two-component system sensor histidine kinase RegB
MDGLLLDQPRHLQRNVRLDTLMRLRWLSVFGQTAAVLVVHYGLGYKLPIWACLAVVLL